MIKVHIDCETRSRADIWSCGAYVYASHPSTELMCLAYAVNNAPIKTIRRSELEMYPLSDPFEELRVVLADPKSRIYSHNSLFEQLVFKFILTPKFDFPQIPTDKYRCTAAKTLAHGLPKALKDVAHVLKVGEQKDMGGRAVMLKVCKPKSDGTWNEDPELLRQLEEYCAQDVRTERDIDHRLPELSAEEQWVWFEDQLINQRGIAVDTEALGKCLELIELETKHLTDEIKDLTGGQLEGVSRRLAVLEYFRKNGVELPDFTKATVETALKSGKIPPKLTQILRIRQQLGLTSTAKYEALKEAVCEDGRLRDTLVYHSAGTGRWCMPGDAEILTPDGWERMDCFSGKPILAVSSYGPCLWDANSEMNVFSHDGPMVGINHRFLRGVFTPEHRFPLTTGVKTAAELKPEDCVKLTAGYGLFTQDPVCTRVRVMIQADAHIITNKRSGRCLKFHFKKARKIARAKLLLDHANIPYAVKEYTCGTEIRVRWCDLPEWARRKHFGPDILDHSPAVFIDELKYWDSHTDKRNNTGGFEYTSTSQNDAEWVVTMAHLSGVSASIVARKRQHVNWAPSFRVHIRMREHLRLKGSSISRTVFTGKVYCPTTETGFFLCRYNGHIFVSGNSGKLVQMQNLPRGTVKDTDGAIELIKTCDIETLRTLYGDVMGLLSSCIRGMFVAPEGKDLIVADYASIEARVLMWLAGQDDAVKMFRDGVDIYVEMAKRIGQGATRQLGKQAVLGCGYGMGSSKFADTCRKYGIEVTDQLAEKAVGAYRSTFARVPALWYAMERAMKTAIHTHKTTTCGKIKFEWSGEFLYMILPSGRRIAYHKAQMENEDIVYMTTNGVTKKYEKTGVYGGKIVENAVQGIARDILAHAMLESEKAGYKVVLTVHDELVVEIEKGKGSVEEFVKIITNTPAWAKGCPISAEAWRGERYKK